MVWVVPVATATRSSATLQVSTHTMAVHSSSPKSPIAADLAIHGFQTTALAESAARTVMARPPAGRRPG